MSLAWNLPFALLVVMAMWIRLGKGQILVTLAAPITGFFGCEPERSRQAATDWLGGAGVIGLLFVAWSPVMSVDSAGWLALDAAVTALGGGLVYAWLMDILAERHSPASGRELDMMTVDDLPLRRETGTRTAVLDTPRSSTEM